VLQILNIFFIFKLGTSSRTGNVFIFRNNLCHSSISQIVRTYAKLAKAAPARQSRKESRKSLKQTGSISAAEHTEKLLNVPKQILGAST
jgi:CRISPR/Cas system-associated protein endoribonuclease Cas2